MKKSAGFTLVELIVVMLIVAIIASIAIPGYRDAVRKSNRRAAQAEMMDLVNRERQYFIANRTFGTHTDLNYTLPPELTGKYTAAITTTNGPPPGFTITFTAVGVQTPDGPLSLTSEGVKTPANKW
jgi:type IV pilus assembly protein PilE